MLLKRENCEIILEVLSAGDFYKPVHANMFHAISELYWSGHPIDATTVGSKMAEEGTPIIDGSIFISLTANVPSTLPTHALAYAKVVETASVGRQLLRMTQDTVADVAEGGDPFDASDELMRSLLTIGSADVGQEAQTIQELEDDDSAMSEVIVPGLLYRDHRGIITAKPGAGKSSLLKMIGMCASQGIQPFTRQDMTPIRVLCVDAENPAANILDTMVPLRETLRARSGVFDEGRFRVWRKPGGMNIRKRRHRTELQREIALHEPDLLLMGPVYKCSRRAPGESYEGAAEGFIDVIDDLRTKKNHEFAVLLEAHVSKNTEDFTPQGSIELAQWSELGLALKPEGEFPYRKWDLEDYRGQRVQGLRWPKWLTPEPNWLFEGHF